MEERNFYQLDLTKPYKFEEREAPIITQDFLFTDGRIISYGCRQRELREQKHSTEYYVNLIYEFKDADNLPRTAVFKRTYLGHEPPFYVGRYVLVAFNQSGSYILSEFTLTKESEEELSKTEERRCAKNYGGLDGNTLNVDKKKKLKSADPYSAWFIMALIIFIAVAACYALISVLGLPYILALKARVLVIIICLAVYLLPSALLIIAICFCSVGVKKKSRYNKVMKNNPYFTYGAVAYSEKTYRGELYKTVNVFFIDYKGEKHIGEISSPVIYRKLEAKNIEYVVAYDERFNFVVLYGSTVNA